MFDIRQDIIFKDVLMELGLTEERITENILELFSRPEEIDTLYDVLKGGLLRKKFALDEVRKVLLCVDEGFSNAIAWGNRRIKNKKVIVKYYISRELCAVYLEDQGEGFDTFCLAENITSCNFNDSNIRGLFLIDKYMDKTILNSKGNKLMMTKYSSFK